jgi:hypothetical protein
MAYHVSQLSSAWDYDQPSHDGPKNPVTDDRAVVDDDLQEMPTNNSLAAPLRRAESPEKYQKNEIDRAFWGLKRSTEPRETSAHKRTSSAPTRTPSGRFGIDFGLRSWNLHRSRSELDGKAESNELVVTGAEEKKEGNRYDGENADKEERKQETGCDGEGTNEVEDDRL